MPMLFWRNQTFWFSYVKLPFMGLLITGLTQVLLFHKFKLVKHNKFKFPQVIAAVLMTWAVTTVVIEVVFHAVLNQNFTDRRL